MRYTRVFATASMVASSMAATIPAEPWTTLTPTATYSGATSDYNTSFGIEVVTISASASSRNVEASATAPAKRDVVNQIGDGQIQQQTSETLSYISATTAEVINQIGDGQIQHQTSTAQVVNQIGDGQIQHQTATTAQVINQIGDGQIQHQTTTTSTAQVINQIGDGQIQHQTTSTTEANVSQITDGQVQATDAANSDSDISSACLTENSLAMVLNDSVLTDQKGRIGAIVANRQFQFDGPPPQAGSIYAAGWSITPEGNLAIGDNDVFWQCASGDFYNLYDENIAPQCHSIHLKIINLVNC